MSRLGCSEARQCSGISIRKVVQVIKAKIIITMEMIWIQMKMSSEDTALKSLKKNGKKWPKKVTVGANRKLTGGTGSRTESLNQDFKTEMIMSSVRCGQNVTEHMNGIMALRFGPEEVTRDLGKGSSSGLERTEARMKYRLLLYTTVIGTRGICSSHELFTRI